MNTTTKTNTSVTAGNCEVDQVGIGVIGVLSALIGTWGIACLVGGIYQYGMVGMLKGWISAVMGI